MGEGVATDPTQALVLKIDLVSSRATSFGGQLNELFIKVEKRHVATGAAAKPHCCEPRLRCYRIHTCSFRAVTIYFRKPRSFFISATLFPFEKRAPVGAHLNAFPAVGTRVALAPRLAQV